MDKILEQTKPSAFWRLFAFGLLLGMAGCSASEEPSVTALEEQLAGEHCRFYYPFGEECRVRNEGFWQWLLREPHHCDWAAVRCLSDIQTSAAYDALIKVLKSKSDIETCDGTRYIRTEAVKALGASGYDPAIRPLKDHLGSNPTARLSSGATGCKARPEPIEEIADALEKLTRQP